MNSKFKRRVLLGENLGNKTKKKHVEHPYSKQFYNKPIDTSGISCVMPPKQDKNDVCVVSDIIGETVVQSVNLMVDMDLAAEYCVGKNSEPAVDELDVPLPETMPAPIKIPARNESTNEVNLLEDDVESLVDKTLCDIQDLLNHPGPQAIKDGFSQLNELPSKLNIAVCLISNDIVKMSLSRSANYIDIYKSIVNTKNINLVCEQYLELIPDQMFLISDREAKFCATEFLRRFSIQLTGFLRNPPPNDSSLVSAEQNKPRPNSKTTRDEELLYYVAGSTINSVKRNKCVVDKNKFLAAVSYQGDDKISNELIQKMPYLIDWSKRMNRGGLTFVTLKTYYFFVAINRDVEKLYSAHNNTLLENTKRKEKAKSVIMNSKAMVATWRTILEPLFLTEAEAIKLLGKLLDSFLNLRGKALAIFYRTMYQIKNRESLKSQPSLRKGLKKKNEDHK